MNKSFLLGILFTGLIGGVWAQSPATSQSSDAQAAPQTEGDKSASVEGIVVNDLTKVPLRRAEVQLFKTGKDAAYSYNASPTYAAVTDVEGKFKIEKIEVGEYRVQTRRTGFVNAGGSFGQSSTMLELAAEKREGAARMRWCRRRSSTGACWTTKASRCRTRP